MATSRTAVFRRIVRDHMAPPPVQVRGDATARELLLRLRERGGSAAVVVNGENRLIGIVTDQNLIQRLEDTDQTVAELMTRPVLTVRDDDQVYRAIGCMRRHRLRHMPVIDAAGAVVGMLELLEALEATAGPMLEVIDWLTREDTLAGLAEVKAAQIRLAERLLADGVSAPEIQGLLADINNDIHRRALDLLLVESGAPPVPFACIVMGSGGRGESLLCPDQDNGFVLADYPDEWHGEIDTWFVALAERFTTILDGMRFPLCQGGVMATNPVWRKTQAQWREQVEIWMAGRVPVALLNCDILFDFRCVWGDRGLFEPLRRDLTEAAARDHRFQMLMFGLQREHHAGIGLFGRLQTEHEETDHRGWIDLKQRGTLPLVEAVRLLALARGVAVTGTLDRIAALQANDALNPDDADRLAAAFTNLASLQLRQQLADHAAERVMSNFVDPNRLTSRQHELLRTDLRAINDFRSRLRADLTGSLL